MMMIIIIIINRSDYRDLLDTIHSTQLTGPISL